MLSQGAKQLPGGPKPHVELHVLASCAPPELACHAILLAVPPRTYTSIVLVVLVRIVFGLVILLSLRERVSSCRPTKRFTPSREEGMPRRQIREYKHTGCTRTSVQWMDGWMHAYMRHILTVTHRHRACDKHVNPHQHQQRSTVTSARHIPISKSDCR